MSLDPEVTEYQRHRFAFVTAAVESHLAHQPAPSLLSRAD
jgi:hypothetical protein